jgi:hypothetical protein
MVGQKALKGGIELYIVHSSKSVPINHDKNMTVKIRPVKKNVFK